MFFQILRQLTSPDAKAEWSCGMCSRGRGKGDGQATPRKYVHRQSAVECVDVIEANELDYSSQRYGSDRPPSPKPKLKRNAYGFEEAAAEGLAFAEPFGDAADRKETKLYHKELADASAKLKEQVTKHGDGHVVRGLSAVALAANQQAGTQKRPEYKHQNSVQSTGSEVQEPDINADTVLSEHFQEEMSRIRVVCKKEHEYKAKMQAYAMPAVGMSSKKERNSIREEFKRKDQEEVDAYHNALRAKMKEIGGTEETNFRCESPDDLCNVVREGVEKYTRTSAQANLYYPIKGHEGPKMTRKQRVEVDYSIKVLERNRL